jgi:hypothetical protein
MNESRLAGDEMAGETKHLPNIMYRQDEHPANLFLKMQRSNNCNVGVLPETIFLQGVGIMFIRHLVSSAVYWTPDNVYGQEREKYE